MRLGVKGNSWQAGAREGGGWTAESVRCVAPCQFRVAIRKVVQPLKPDRAPKGVGCANSIGPGRGAARLLAPGLGAEF
jgi:hypothetical protein